MTIFRRFILAGLGCALGAAPAAAAPEFENLDLLDSRVAVFLGAPVGQPGGAAQAIDRRLKLAACPATPMLALPTPMAAVVECQAVGWRIHVPLVRAQRAAAREAKAEAAEPVVRKGDQVEVVADGGNFTVSTLAIAQQDGAPGAMIRVRTDAKAAPITAQVEAHGKVVVSRFK